MPDRPTRAATGSGLLHDRGSVLRDRALEAKADLEPSGNRLIVLVIVAAGACLVFDSVDERR